MEKQEYEDGYYWVKSNDKWMIAEYDNLEWFICGTEASQNTEYLQEIGSVIKNNQDYVPANEYCATRVINVLNHNLVKIARNNIGKIINDVPEVVDILKASDIIDKYINSNN